MTAPAEWDGVGEKPWPGFWHSQGGKFVQWGITSAPRVDFHQPFDAVPALHAVVLGRSEHTLISELTTSGFNAEPRGSVMWWAVS